MTDNIAGYDLWSEVMLRCYPPSDASVNNASRFTACTEDWAVVLGKTTPSEEEIASYTRWGLIPDDVQRLKDARIVAGANQTDASAIEVYTWRTAIRLGMPAENVSSLGLVALTSTLVDRGLAELGLSPPFDRWYWCIAWLGLELTQMISQESDGEPWEGNRICEEYTLRRWIEETGDTPLRCILWMQLLSNMTGSYRNTVHRAQLVDVWRTPDEAFAALRAMDMLFDVMETGPALMAEQMTFVNTTLRDRGVTAVQLADTLHLVRSQEVVRLDGLSCRCTLRVPVPAAERGSTDHLNAVLLTAVDLTLFLAEAKIPEEQFGDWFKIAVGSAAKQAPRGWHEPYAYRIHGSAGVPDGPILVNQPAQLMRDYAYPLILEGFTVESAEAWYR